MRIDRYVHDERLTWGAAGVLFLVTAIHAAGIGRLLTMPLETETTRQAPVFQVSLQKLPPPKLPPEFERRKTTPSEAPADAKRQKPRLTRPVPILVDTPTTDPVPPDTQVKQYEMGDELLPGEPGPPMPEGTLDGTSTEPVVEPPPVLQKLKVVDMRPPAYPPRCRRMGIQGIVRVRALVGEDGRVMQALVAKTSGDDSLDEAAVEAVNTWRFEPARRDGVPIRAWASVPIEFKLVD
ncbi:MAG TPA: energy transducer TonB [Steroidobacteraceae bacterium]|nr:energy transducer TonB [Steroidobacteraceae bacterium]